MLVPIRVNEYSKSFLHAVDPLAVVDVALGPLVDAVAVALAGLLLPLVEVELLADPAALAVHVVVPEPPLAVLALRLEYLDTLPVRQLLVLDACLAIVNEAFVLNF